MRPLAKLLWIFVKCFNEKPADFNNWEHKNLTPEDYNFLPHQPAEFGHFTLRNSRSHLKAFAAAAG